MRHEKSSHILELCPSRDENLRAAQATETENKLVSLSWVESGITGEGFLVPLSRKNLIDRRYVERGLFGSA